MFRKVQNIDTAFRHIKNFSLFLMTGCIALCCFAVYQSYILVSGANNRIYILANGKVLEAYAADRKDNVPVEARDHVRTFHQYFFTLHPDDKVIQSHITKALYLADGTARRQHQSLKENGFYAEVISGNISQEISIDSVLIDVDQYPFFFRCHGEQKIIRPSSITTRNLVTEGYLRQVARSDNNPHGFLIEKWKTLENGTLKTEKR